MFCLNLLRVFCCPPCPQSIVAKYAFHPPRCSYDLEKCEEDPTKYYLAVYKEPDSCVCDNPNTDGKMSKTPYRNVECHYVNTSNKNRIVCMYVKSPHTAKFTILFSHANGCDLGQIIKFLQYLSSFLKCNILAYDYSGYGKSTGLPTERNTYSDIEAAWEFMKNRYELTGEDVILYGWSIGTAPTIHLASKFNFKAVIIHSGFTSARDIVCPNGDSRWCCNPFNR